jgi:hypothetical protein
MFVGSRFVFSSGFVFIVRFGFRSTFMGSMLGVRRRPAKNSEPNQEPNPASELRTEHEPRTVNLEP